MQFFHSHDLFGFVVDEISVEEGDNSPLVETESNLKNRSLLLKSIIKIRVFQEEMDHVPGGYMDSHLRAPIHPARTNHGPNVGRVFRRNDGDSIVDDNPGTENEILDVVAGVGSSKFAVGSSLEGYTIVETLKTGTFRLQEESESV